jgi:hypothetical protein
MSAVVADLEGLVPEDGEAGVPGQTTSIALSTGISSPRWKSLM